MFSFVQTFYVKQIYHTLKIKKDSITLGQFSLVVLFMQ